MLLNMSMYDWAEQECRIACKKENPDFNFDSKDFDYGCSCYKSALKAYKSLCKDGHSGASFNFTSSFAQKTGRLRFTLVSTIKKSNKC